LGACKPFQDELHDQYERFRTRYGSHLRGIIEIGSYARGENIACSDHDLRLVIDCQDPLLVFNEESWTERPEGSLYALVEWEELNQVDGMSFGLTNLAFIENLLRIGRFPLIDHTCLYQGRILIDEAGAVETFRAKNDGVRFSNIVPDYLRQTEWRVTYKLPREINTLTERFIARKYALPAVHTCFRIVRDLANIATYHEYGSYLCDHSSLLSYYRAWPWFEPTLEKVRTYKTNETVRRAVFNDVMEGKSERIAEIKEIARATVKLWEQFHKRFRRDHQTAGDRAH